MSRSFFTWSLCLFVGSLIATASPAEAVSPYRSLIKGSGPTVYWYSFANRVRYAFPNEGTFVSWFERDNLRLTETFSDSDLNSIPEYKRVTYRPGARLLKASGDPRVYAVARFNLLRWVTDENVARALYGQRWWTFVDTLPNELWQDYTLGSPITSAADYNRDDEYNFTRDPSDLLRRPPEPNAVSSFYIPPPSYYSSNPPTNSASSGFQAVLVPTLSRYNVHLNETITLSAAIYNSTLDVSRLTIRLFDDEGRVLQSCRGGSACDAALTVTRRNYRRSYGADVTDDAGRTITARSRVSVSLAENVVELPTPTLPGYMDFKSELLGDPTNQGIRLTGKLLDNPLNESDITVFILHKTSQSVVQACPANKACQVTLWLGRITETMNINYEIFARDLAGRESTRVTREINLVPPPDKESSWLNYIAK